MESHPYTKPRGVGPVTTELTPGAEPDYRLLRAAARPKYLGLALALSAFPARSRCMELGIDTRKTPVRHCGFGRKSLRGGFTHGYCNASR